MDRALLLSQRAIDSAQPSQARGWLLAARELLVVSEEASDSRSREEQMAVDQLLDARALLAMEADRLAQHSAESEALEVLPGAVWSAHRAYWEHVRSEAELHALARQLASELVQIDQSCEGEPAPSTELQRSYYRCAGIVELLALSEPTRASRLRHDRLRLLRWAERDEPACQSSASLRWRLSRWSSR